jgi:ATP-dependent Lon protease
MTKPRINSPTLQRMEQVLLELRIKFEISDKGYFILPTEKIILDESEKLKNLLHKNEDFLSLGISNEGEIRDIHNRIYFFKLCFHCNKFFLDKGKSPQTEQCIFCQKKEVKYLAQNGKIPGWKIQPPKEYILGPDFSLPSINCLKDEKQELIKEIAKKLSGSVKYLTFSDEKIKEFATLGKNYPNMKSVQDYINKQIELSKMKIHKDFSTKPILLLGNAGCGKTSYVFEFAKIYQGKPPIRIDLGNDVPTFTCVGSDPGYSDAKHGLILESMFSDDDKHPVKNPIIHFDELDKINSSNRYSIEKIFYSILERSTSKNFRDNFFGVDVDASGINYIFTANSIENIPKPILNRLRVFEIPDYTEEQLREVVIDNFYQKWLNINNLNKECFPEVLSDEIKDKVIQYSKCDPRSINDVLTELFTTTMRYDNETGQQIALFSDEELCGGWKHFRGKNDIPMEKWKLPKNFRLNFDPVKFLDSYV